MNLENLEKFVAIILTDKMARDKVIWYENKEEYPLSP